MEQSEEGLSYQIVVWIFPCAVFMWNIGVGFCNRVFMWGLDVGVDLEFWCFGPHEEFWFRVLV